MKALILSLIPLLTLLLFFYYILKSKNPSRGYLLFCLYFFPVIYSSDYNYSVFHAISYFYFFYSFRNNSPLFSKKIYVLSVYLIVVIFLGALNSEFVTNSILGLLKFIPIIIYIHVILSECLKDDAFIFEIIRILKKILIFGFVFLLLQIILGLNFTLFIQDNPNITFESIRYPGFFQDPQKFAQFLSILSFVALIKAPDSKFTIYNYALFGLAVISLFLTGGRAALLGLVLGLAFIVLFSSNKVKVIAIICGFLIAAVLYGLSEYFIVFSRGETLKDSYEIRSEIWLEAYEIYKKHTFLGIGIDNYSKYVERYAQDQFWLVDGEKAYFDHPESGYLKFLTELGLLGTLGIFTFLFSAIYRGIKVFVKRVMDFNIIYLISALLSWFVGFYSVYSLGDVRIMILIATVTCILIAYSKRYNKEVIIVD